MKSAVPSGRNFGSSVLNAALVSAGIKAGDPRPYPTVATYPVHGAYAAVKKIALRPGAISVKVSNGGIAVIDPAHLNSVYLAYPRADVEVEVFDPSAGRAHQLVDSGAIVPVG